MQKIERKIIVTNKQGKQIAVFSNSNHIQDKEYAKDVMVAPTINISQNGESTLSFQMMHTSPKWQDIKNPENLYECNDRIYTALNENSIVYNGAIVEVTLVETWYLLSKVFVQAYNMDTKIEAVDIHTVKILPKSTSKLVVNGTQYDDNDVRDITGKVMPRGSAGYALWAILKGTNWQLGVCDVLPNGFDASKDYGTFNVESDMKSALENIQYIQQLYGGILDWDSKNKILNLRDETKEGTDFNTWKGYSVRKDKNLNSAPVITWDNNIITRLYPLGNGNLNIKRVNNNKEYIENFSYTNSVYEGYLQNSNIYDTNDEGGQKTLKFWAEKQLEKMCKPRKSIQYDIVDLRNLKENSFETFDINDIVKAYYTDTENGEEIFEFLRITNLSYNYFYPSSESIIEVGDKVANETELFYQIYKSDKNSAPTDYNGNISGFDISIEIPEAYWGQFGGFGYTNINNITSLYAEKFTETTEAIAEVYVYADETFATVESYTTFVNETNERFSQSNTRITQVSDALSAQITLEASHFEQLKGSINTTTESLASFQAYANRNFATTTQLSKYSTKDETGRLISQSEASIKTYANERYASITLSATVNELNNRTSGVQDRGATLQVTSNYAGMYIPASGGIIIKPSNIAISINGNTEVSGTEDTRVMAGSTLYLHGKTINCSGTLVINGSVATWNNKGYLVKA